MIRTCHDIIDSITTLLGLMLAAALLAAGQASADGLGSSPPAVGPRWSNDHHHVEGIVIGRDCIAPSPDYRAGYVSGIDAWGQPVIPAETTVVGGNSSLTTELDIHLKHMHRAGHDLDLSATTSLDIDPLAGTSGPQDCFPAFK